MTTKDNGGPAFPQSELVTGARDWHGDIIPPHVISGGGMTLRDWLAGQAERLDRDAPNSALETLIGEPIDPAMPRGSIAHWRLWAKADAAWRYMQADAMIAERSK